MGTCSVTATKDTDNNYKVASSAPATVALRKASQATVTITGPSTLAYGVTANLSSGGGSGSGTVSYSHGASTGCSVSGATLSVTNANGSGTCAVTATKATDNNYESATSAPVTVALIAVSVPNCTLGASPATIPIGSSSTLTPNCSPAADTYTWTGGTCVGTTGSTCTVTPTSTTTYSVTGTNAGGTGTAANATVTVLLPAVSLAPSSLTFAEQLVNTSTAQNATLTNTGAGPLTIASIGTSVNVFSVPNSCGVNLVLAAGASCNLSVTFTPTAAITRVGALTVTSNAAGSPHSISLTGSGYVANSPQCTLNASPNKVRRNGTSVLTANCSPAATSFTWTGGTCQGTTASTCSVTTSATTSYSVTGTNSYGSSTANAQVTVKNVDLTPILMLLLD
jgi:hypothetical protein